MHYRLALRNFARHASTLLDRATSAGRPSLVTTALFSQANAMRVFGKRGSHLEHSKLYSEAVATRVTQGIDAYDLTVRTYRTHHAFGVTNPYVEHTRPFNAGTGLGRYNRLSFEQAKKALQEWEEQRTGNGFKTERGPAQTPTHYSRWPAKALTAKPQPLPAP